MNGEPIFIKNDDHVKEITRPGRLYRMMIKSKNFEAIIAEIEPNAESRWYQHGGEEIHLVLEGEMEYEVGEKSYKLKEGDILWHHSSVKHHAKNIGDKNVKYITVGTPPTLTWTDL